MSDPFLVYLFSVGDPGIQVLVLRRFLRFAMLISQLKPSDVILRPEPLLEVDHHLVDCITVEGVVYMILMDHFLDKATEMGLRSLPLVIPVKL